MRRRLFVVLTIAIVAILAIPVMAGAMPANEVALKKALTKRGVIPTGASAQYADLVLSGYLQRKHGGKPDDLGNPVARRALKAAAEDGSPGLTAGAAAADDRVPDANILVLLVEFAGEEGGVKGPLHDEIPDPRDPSTGGDPNDNTTYWVEHFSPDHYEQMLFSPAHKSFTNYFLEQSGGTYMPGGEVSAEWVKLPHSEWWYGGDREYGDDDLNGPVWRLAQDAVEAAGDSIDWAKYDVKPKDGFVDHIMILHAGMGQEAGGGAQGDSAIWSHSWWANYGKGGPGGLGGVLASAGPDGDPDTMADNVYVGPYTTEPEDGTVGVFVHEFAHDLGAPDLYDTEYTGEASTGFWTCMASGSWLGEPGQPLGTSPSGLDIWTKWLLGWADPVEFDAGDDPSTVSLAQASAEGVTGKAIKVDLPDKGYTTALTDPHSGDTMWWSSMGDDLENTLTQEFALSATNPTLSFWTWFDIEAGYDYGYIEVQTEGSDVWTSVAGNLTTEVDGNFGITGISGTKWLFASYDLSKWAGTTVKVRFRYLTDGGLALKGWVVDDIMMDGVAVSEGWIASPESGGWMQTGNPVQRTAKRSYMAEWRQPIGFDTSMNAWYNWLPGGNGNTAEFIAGSPGMLVWYSNTEYADNWVGMHPWSGRLLLVDSHPTLETVPNNEVPMKNGLTKNASNEGKTLPIRTRLQLFDAAFSADAPTPQTLHAFGVEKTMGDSKAVPAFDGGAKWYDDSFAPFFKVNRWAQIMKNAISSVNTPESTVKMTVLSGDADAAQVRVEYPMPE